jgi:transposase InsO family protein
LYVSFFNEALNKTDVFLINAIVLESSPVDLLIGKATIRKTQIFSRVPSQLSSNSVSATSVAAVSISKTAETAKPSCGCQPKGESIAPVSIPATFAHLSQSTCPTATQTRGVLAALLIESEQLLGVAPLDDDEINYDKTDMFSHWLSDSTSDKLSDGKSIIPTVPEPDVLDQIHISGSEFLQAKLHELCLEFKDIFCNDLPSAPAKIPPFKLDVDELKWRIPKNRTPPRPQSQEKQAEIARQLDILLKQGIIRVSQSAHYSQVLMVPKPGGKWRMCVDFRALNDCTLDASWPIPNIAEMLRRIGAQRCKIFGIMDLTQGYHQAPLDPDSCKYTAFILYSGCYEFTRLPFGPKRAPSYFQEQMATVVLAGLIYSICEIYIDDCNVFAQTDEEFLDRLRQIFTRFRKHNMFLKAQKCFFGYSEIDFVGKVLSEEGLKMSQLKIQSVLDFPIPLVSKQLKSFLGIVNYFRDFVRNASTIVKPLHGLIADYHKAQKIKWSSEAITAFNTVKTEISKCTIMHFLNDLDPIYLHTDASDYGIGGYLFQIVNGIQHPIAFVSKSLSKTQLRWSVIQKEAYAIFFVILYLESLLRDRVFTIRTDHLNLLFITQASNPMIVRWYMALSEFSFKIEFIKGVDNGIADSMSRLCRNGMLDHPEEYPRVDAIAASIIPKIKLTSVIYSKIASVHNSRVGHFGLERTVKRLQNSNNSWEFMRQHVRYFIDHCPCCQKMSLLKIPIAAHAFTTSSYTPMECLNIDFIGPFPDEGYILVIVDTFTRWVELYPTTDATAVSAAQALLQHFGRFGAPHQLRSDNGPHFIADLIREFLSLLGTQHCLTLAYSKQENSIVERYNKEINRHIRALTYDNNSLTDYRFSLPFVQRILNSNYSDRLKISAADMLFGKIVKLDRGIFEPLQNNPLQDDVRLSTHMSKLLSVQDNLIKASAKELLRTDLLHQTAAQTLNYTEHLPDSYVLVHYRTGAPPTRLHTHWRGPMKVKSGSDSRYLLYDLITHKEKTYHVSDMKPFIYDPAITSPLDVARRDYMEFFVESIIDHRGNIKRKTDLEFLVSWLGYDDRDNSWEPYSYLRDTGKLHDYLTLKNMRQLIPAKFR